MYHGHCCHSKLSFSYSGCEPWKSELSHCTSQESVNEKSEGNFNYPEPVPIHYCPQIHHSGTLFLDIDQIGTSGAHGQMGSGIYQALQKLLLDLD